MTLKSTRQISLDTETTGINKFGACYEGHRIIEIGAVEIINRRLTGRHYHTYINPDQLVDSEAYKIHGISNAFLINQPFFYQIIDEFIDFIHGSDLILHNSEFDISFIDHEFRLLKKHVPLIKTFCNITDTLLIARRLFPGKRNNLDALCNRYKIDNSKRSLHGALLDAEILAEVYLAMTGGQTSMIFHVNSDNNQIDHTEDIQHIIRPSMAMKVIYASDKELSAHETYLDCIEKKVSNCLWRT